LPDFDGLRDAIRRILSAYNIALRLPTVPWCGTALRAARPAALHPLVRSPHTGVWIASFSAGSL
jgi:hypothetical protein